MDWKFLDAQPTFEPLDPTHAASIVFSFPLLVSARSTSAADQGVCLERAVQHPEFFQYWSHFCVTKPDSKVHS